MHGVLYCGVTFNGCQRSRRKDEVTQQAFRSISLASRAAAISFP